MKRVLVILAMALSAAAWADTEAVGDYTWTYQINGETAKIENDYSAAISPLPTGVVTIPSMLGGKPVTRIGDYAFCYCSGLTSVTIPDWVTSIGDMAFAGCSGLTSMTIPDSVTKIGESAFSACSDLASVTIPGSVRNIGDWMFQNCSGLTSVTIGNGVTSIGCYAFDGCSGLTSVKIPDSVTSIGEAAFADCSGLVDLTISASLSAIDDFVFLECSGLTSVAIPDSVTSIGYCAFSRCTSLTSLTIPDAVTNIGISAFAECTMLKSVVVPASVTQIGYGAFAGCAGVSNFVVDVDNANYMSVNGMLLSKDGKTLIQGFGGEVVIPDSVTSIDAIAFNSCTGVTSVTIPESVENVGQYAFYNCSGLMSVTMQGDCPEVGSGAFAMINSSCVVHLPGGNATYEVTDGKWQGMTVEWYDVLTVGIAAEKGEIAASGDGVYRVTAREDVSLTEADIVIPEAVKGAYRIEIATDGRTATVALAAPTLLAPDGEALAADEADPAGVLVAVDENVIAANPVPGAGESVGALPVKTYPGLYYQASWGGELDGLTAGEKVRADGGSLYLGVIRQTGSQGFYKLTVSEQ